MNFNDSLWKSRISNFPNNAGNRDNKQTQSNDPINTNVRNSNFNNESLNINNKHSSNNNNPSMNRSESLKRNSQSEAASQNAKGINALSSSSAKMDLKNNISYNNNSLYNQAPEKKIYNNYNDNESLYSKSNNNNKSISENSQFNTNNNQNRPNYNNNQKQNTNHNPSFYQQRDNISDLNSGIDSQIKDIALGFFKKEENDSNKFNINGNHLYYADDDFDTKINKLGGAITNSIYIDDSMRNLNGSEHIKNITISESIPLGDYDYNNNNNQGNYRSEIGKSMTRNSSFRSSSIRFKNNNNNNNINDNKNHDYNNNGKITNIDVNKQNKNNNNTNSNNSLYENYNNNKNDSNTSKNINCRGVNSECLNNIIEIISKSDSINNSEIKNDKIFSSGSLSKSYSQNIDDFVRVQDTPINKQKLSLFYDLLIKNNKAFFENFFTSLKNCGFSHPDIQYNKIGPISSLEHYIQFKFSDFLKANEPILAIDLLENNIFRWRNICGDGNCFYRAVMFSYLENILINNSDFEYLNFIKEIYEFIQKAEIKKIFEKNNIDYDFLLRALFFILYIKTNETMNGYRYTKYEMLIMLINNCRDIDLGLVLYLRIKIFEFIESNKNKIYSQEFNVKMGNLLSEKYQAADEESFQWQLFYDENLLKLYTEAENIIIYVTPLILKMNLKIFTYDIGADNADKVRLLSCGLPNKHTAFVFYRKIHYDLIYSKEHFELIQNNFKNYFDTNVPSVCVERLKIEARQALWKINKDKENESMVENMKNKNDENSFFYNDSSINQQGGEQKDLMESEDQYKVNNSNNNKVYDNKNTNNTNNICINKSEININKNNNTVVEENPCLIDFNGTKLIDNHIKTNTDNISKIINNSVLTSGGDNNLINKTINNSKSGLGRKETYIENGSNIVKHSINVDDLNEKQENMDIDDIPFNILTNSINEFEKNDKNEVLNKEIKKSLMQKNNSVISSYIPNSNPNTNPNSNSNQSMQNKSDLMPLDNNNNIQNNFIPNRNPTHDVNKISSENSNNYNLTKAESTSQKQPPCYVCEEEIDLKISNFFGKALCANCFFKELKSILSIKIFRKIEASVEMLLRFRESKSFAPYDNIFKFDDYTPLTIFNNISDVQDYKKLLQIDFEKLIKNILAENCLICLHVGTKNCQPKNFITLPCSNCCFYSLHHFKIFLQSLIKVNAELKSLKNFTCLCNAEYSVSDILKVFEIINENKLHEEFYALKNYLMEIYFKRFCCLCSKLLEQVDFKRKKLYDLTDNMIGMFVHVTDFQHFACLNCGETIENMIVRQKKQNRPLVFPCNICSFEHLFKK